MADNTKIWPIFRWANWGLSDDLFTGIRNSFYFSNDMEIREDAKSIYPKWTPAYASTVWFNQWVNVWNWGNGQHTVKCATFTWQDWWWVVCLDKDIYKVNLITWWLTPWYSVSLLCTMPEEICDMEVFNWYVYVSTRTHIFYKKNNGTWWTDMASSTTDTNNSYGRMSQSLKSNGNHPLYASDVCLCIWDCNILWKVTKEIPNLLQDWFKIQSDYYIRFINELWWFIRITAVNNPYWSEVFLWDKYSEAPSEVIPLDWYVALGSTIYHWYHYLISNQWLWLLNGYQYYILKKMKSDIQTDIRNCMAVYDDMLYIVWEKWVYIYWWKNKSYADVLSLWHQVEDGYTLWTVASYWEELIITRNYKNVPWGTNIPVRVGINIPWTNWETTPTTWEIQTMAYYGTSMSEIKQAMYLRVGYHIPKEWANSGNIHIYYRTEADATNNDIDSWQWHEVTKQDWLYADWDMRSPFATTLKLNCRFQWIQFKFVSTNCVRTDDWTTYSKDTNLYSADLYYNTMLD